MNIIELFEKLNIKNEYSIAFSSDEIIRIENQINIEKRTNSLIDSNVATNLINALKNHPEVFYFFVNHRDLYNFFAKTNYSKDWFTPNNTHINNDDLRKFINAFLENDLVLFFDQKMTQNKFEELSNLLLYKDYFPEDVVYKISKKPIDKIDFAIARLYQERKEYDALLYNKQAVFYDFLSHFSSTEIDAKLQTLLKLVTDIYNKNKKSEFASSALLAMSNYKSFKVDLIETIKSNPKVVYSNKKKRSSPRNSINSGYIGGAIVVILFFILRIGMIVHRYSNSDNDTNQDAINYNSNETEEPTIDRYYADMYYKLDSFHNYLVDFDKSKFRNLHYNDSIKTGDNPFVNLYKKNGKTESNNTIKFYNDSDYDIILLENYVTFDSINMPSQAYFIKSKKGYELNNVSSLNRVFNFYAGKRLASFHGDNENIFVRNNSIEESRFTELASNSKELLKKNYQFTQDVFIKNQNKNITIQSDNLIVKKSNTITQPPGVTEEEPPKVIVK